MKSFKNDAVSPVVGVMLMLVVVIIIAAVVSGFAGKLVGSSSQNAPTLTMDVKIVNSGSWAGSGFFATVTSVSETIPTKDLKIVTAWTATNRASSLLVSGGETTLPNVGKDEVLFNPPNSASRVAPFGNGPGVGNGTETVSGVDTLRDFSAPDQQFGNYSLMAGTTMSAIPCGAKDSDSIGGSNSAEEGYGVDGRFTYHSSSGESWLDPATAVLGDKWELLRIGDTVNVKVIHVPTGKVIFNQDIIVKEG